MNEILSRLAPVVDTLNKIEVKGKDNLLNLAGCIAVVDGVCKDIIESIDKPASDEQ